MVTQVQTRIDELATINAQCATLSAENAHLLTQNSSLQQAIASREQAIASREQAIRELAQELANQKTLMRETIEKKLASLPNMIGERLSAAGSWNAASYEVLRKFVSLQSHCRN